jgi:hypothetical protein
MPSRFHRGPLKSIKFDHRGRLAVPIKILVAPAAQCVSYQYWAAPGFVDTEIGVTPEREDGHSETLKRLLANQEVARSRNGAGNLRDNTASESVP